LKHATQLTSDQCGAPTPKVVFPIVESSRSVTQQQNAGLKCAEYDFAFPSLKADRKVLIPKNAHLVLHVNFTFPQAGAGGGVGKV